MIYCPDANTFITAWNVLYPPKIKFMQPLWKEIANRKKDIFIIEPIMKEIEPITSEYKKLSDEQKGNLYPLRRWIEKNEIPIIKIIDDINQISLELERDYQIHEQSKGANKIDILLIAFAKYHNYTVVTYEAKQPNIPGKKENYKIPLICEEQNVKCITFIEMIDELNISIK